MVGYYFASNGCITVLATYRLLPTARYPQGAEDVASAIGWLAANVAHHGGDPSRITILGQSAGGAHTATALLLRLLDVHFGSIQGIVLLSAPLRYNLSLERRRKNMQLYHDTVDDSEIDVRTAVKVFEMCHSSDMERWPKLLLTVGEYDSDEIVDGNLQFVEAYRTTMKRLPVLEVLADHNHISYALGLGLPDDTVGPRLLRFVQA